MTAGCWEGVPGSTTGHPPLNSPLRWLGMMLLPGPDPRLHGRQSATAPDFSCSLLQGAAYSALCAPDSASAFLTEIPRPQRQLLRRVDAVNQLWLVGDPRPARPPATLSEGVGGNSSEQRMTTSVPKKRERRIRLQEGSRLEQQGGGQVRRELDEGAIQSDHERLGRRVGSHHGSCGVQR